MKKIFYLLLGLLTLTSCGSTSSSFNGEYKNVELHEAVKWDYENNKAFYEGEYISLDAVTITSIIDNIITIGDYDVDNGSYINVASLEVIFDGLLSYKWKDIVDIKGQLLSYNGRCVLKGHQIKYDIDDETERVQGKIITYSIYGRNGYESIDYHSFSGSYIKSTFEIADFFDFEKEDYSLSFVYPGESYKEPYLIKCNIPNSISNDEKVILNNIFNDYEIGDYINLRAQFYFDKEPMLVITPHLFDEDLYIKMDCIVLNSWEETENHLNDYYDINIPDFDDEKTDFYYFDNYSYYESRNMIAIYIYGDDIDKIYEDYYISSLKDGWILSNYQENQFSLVYKINNQTVASIGLSKTNTNLRLMITALPKEEKIISFSSFNDLKNELLSQMKSNCKFVNDLENISLIDNFNAQKYELDLSLLKQNISELIYEFKIILTYENDEKADTDYESLNFNLKSNLIEINYEFLNKYGYFNKNSHEFINVIKQNSKLIINYYLIDPNSAFYPNFQK